MLWTMKARVGNGMIAALERLSDCAVLKERVPKAFSSLPDFRIAARTQAVGAQARETRAPDRALPKVTLYRLGAPLLHASEVIDFRDRLCYHLCGLRGVSPLCRAESVLIRRCRLAHTFGSPRSVDVLFLNDAGTVLERVTLGPSMMVWCAAARQVVKVPEGTLRRLQLEPGHVLVASSGLQHGR